MNTVVPNKEFSEKENFSHFLMEQCLSIRRWALTVALLLYIVFAVMDVIKFPSEIYSITLTTRIILVILPLLYLNFIYWLNPPKSIRTNVLIMLLIYLGSGLNHILISYISGLYGFQFSELGMVLIIMFGCLLLALPIKPASIVTLIVFCAYAAINLYAEHQLADLLFRLIIFSFVAGICLAVNLAGQKTLYKNHLLINRLYNESITDGLTKLNNKRAFLDQIERLTSIAVRDKVTLGLIFVDVDYFKAINDSFGHSAGDEVLKKIASVVDAKCRRCEDLGFRVGGDEFALILYGVDRKKLEETCFEIVVGVSDLNVENHDSSIKTSVSVGAVLKSESAKITNHNLVNLADKHLYEAKGNGRNQFYLQPF